jgi:outer membrane protein assembly factor BamB
MTPVWRRELPADVTSPVVAGGVLLVATTDAHTVHALDAARGESLWNHTVGGRVDSPPTVHQGRAVFGSADGFVYSLRLADGAPAWRFRAAPEDRSLVALGQVESVWPVTGSVLVHDNVIHCTAGRSSYLDGGMNWVRLDPTSGRKLDETRLYSRDPETGRQPVELVDDVEMPGALPDVLSCDGKNVFLRDKILDESGAELEPTVPHLYSSAGLLDDHWWHRTYWIFGPRVYGRASGWAVVANYVPSGRLLVLDESTVFGYGRKRVGGGDRGLADVPMQLFRADQQVTPLAKPTRLKNNNLALSERFVPTRVNYHWTREVPIVVRAMVLAGDTLFVAGPEMAAEADAEEPNFDEGDALLMAFSAQDGSEVYQRRLDAQPVFDGMIAANGRLYLSLNGGTVLCLGP